MRSKLAVTAALILATVGLAPAPAHAAYNSVRQSSYAGNNGAIVVTCAGGATHVIFPGGAASPCFNTIQADAQISTAGIMCASGGSGWIYYGQGIAPTPYAQDYNCRTY